MRFFSQGRLLSPFLALMVLFMLSGCLAGKTPEGSLAAEDLELPFVNGVENTSFYPQETTRWQAALTQASEPQKKAEAHLHLAALALAHDNPQHDYHTGYLELTKATTVWPDLQKNMAIASWLALLNRFESEAQKGTNDRVALENTVARLKDQNATQRQELVKLREIIDKLQRLELSVERKRRSLK